MSARTRRGLALSWSALFVCSLVLQYMAFAAAPAALAAHGTPPGLFELDGNATDSAAIEPQDDWDSLNHAADTFFAGAASEAPGNDSTYFTTGGSKDENDVSAWKITPNSVPDKNELLDTYAAVYQAGGDTWVYFGADRFDNDGTAQIGFWFFQNKVGTSGANFTGVHKTGDVLIISEYTNGGSVSKICAYEWNPANDGHNIANSVGCDPATNGSNLNLVAAGSACDVADGTFDICAVSNSTTQTAPWSFTNKDGAHNFGPGQFFEGGINLSDMFGGNPPCFGTFLAETRSSAETDAQLKDFALGSLSTCVPPTIATQSSTASADFGATVHDTATLSGTNGPASGSVEFFLCGPTASKPDCASGGTQVGSAVAVTTTANGGTATSANYTVGVTAAASGWYCWRAEYTPDADSQYLDGTHTDTDTECFFVAPATIEIEKTANPAGPVNAGDTIGFDIVVTNNGTQTTLGIAVNDPLPAGVDWSLGTVTGGASCSITGSVGSEVLGCTKASLAAGASFSAHVSATTDKTDCGTINNTAGVSTTNDGTDSDGASVTVNCPDVTVAKTPDNGTVNAGSTATFTIVVTNDGEGTATGVTLTDSLPAGYTWSLGGADAASCSIDTVPSPDVLSCNFGTLAKGATRTITLSAPTSGANCAVIPNTATVAATNEPSSATGNNSDNGSIDVLCANVGIVKTANPAGPVSAGAEIGFDITVTNNGDGTATGVSVNDPLPAGIVWSADAPTGDTAGVTCSIDTAPNPDVLTCTDGSMPAGASFTVHIHGTTDAADCGTVSNTATVSTSNDGGGSDDASVVVQCPDLEVVKTGNGPLNAGETATFTIVVTNHGPGSAANVTLTDQLPSGSWTLGGANAASCSINGSNVLSCSFGTLASGASRTITVSKTTSSADCGTIHNDVTVAASNENTDTDQYPNTDDADIVVNCPNVTVLKTADSSPISAGQTAAFTIVVSNTGAGSATNVTLNDPLPAGVAWTINPAVSGCSIASGTLSCSFASLASGASVTIHISGATDAPDCGQLPNTATVDAANEPESNNGDNQSSASITVQCPDLSVVKTADNGTISAGEVAAFTIVVTNHGLGTAFNAHVEDPLPAGIDWVIDPAVTGCGIASGTLSCDFASLAPGASVTIHIHGETVAANCGLVENTVVVSASNEPSGALGDNEDSADITINCPAIVVTKTADAETINAGDPIGFTIQVTNTGAGSATNVTLTDDLPAGITWIADAPTGNTVGVTCGIAAGTLTCTDPSMASGESFSVHIHGVTAAVNCGNVNNTAVVSTGNGDGDFDSSSVTILCPDVTVQKTPDGGSVNAGDNAVFTIVVSNLGPGTAYGVTLTDNLPAGYTWSLGGANAASCSIDPVPNPDVLSCSFGTLAVGATRTVTLTAPTTGQSCAVIPNAASVAASNEAQAQTGNNSDTASIDVRCAEISIDKVADPVGPVNAGDEIGFDITVANGGDGTARDVEMTDDLPGGISWTADAPTGDTDGVDCSITSGTLTCTDDAMAPGDSFTVHVHGLTSAADCGTVNNTASVTTGNDGSDEASASVVVECPDIKVTKTPDADPANPSDDIPAGQDITFTILVQNIGDGIARNVTLTDPLPAGFDWTEDSPDCTITAGTLTCDFGDMAPGASATVHVTAPTDALGENANIDCSESDVTHIPNVAAASADNEGEDVLGNNSDPGAIDVACSVLSIEKGVTDVNNQPPVNDPDLGVPGAKIGDTVTFTLHYTGSGLLENAFIVDVLPIGEDYVAGTASSNADFDFTSATFDSTTHRWTLRWDATGPLTGTTEGDVTYDVKVLAAAAEQPQPLVNVATIDSDQTNPDRDDARIAVAPPPQELTPPPTDAVTLEKGTSNPGYALMLILLGIAVATLGIGFITPVPVAVRRREQRRR